MLCNSTYFSLLWAITLVFYIKLWGFTLRRWYYLVAKGGHCLMIFFVQIVNECENASSIHLIFFFFQFLFIFIFFSLKRKVLYLFTFDFAVHLTPRS